MENNFVVEKNEQGEYVFTFVRSLCQELSDTLLELTDNENFINQDVEMSEGELFSLQEHMKLKVESGNMELLPLVLFLSDCFKVKNEQYEKMSECGKITFDHLSKIFHIGDKFVAIADEGELVGSVVSGCKVEQMQITTVLKVTGTFTFSDGKTFYQENRDFYIPHFGGMRHIDTLNVRPMKPQEEAILTERGNLFVKYALKPNYCAYTGTMFVTTMYGCMHFDSTGRIMIDHIGSRKNRPEHNNLYYGGQTQKNTFDVIPNELLYLTWPFFDAFSCKAKRWGKAYVRNVSEIKYDDQAFNTLVLDDKKKKLIKALVLHSDKGFTDIISDKSGGCIFLLHGLPGTGKTLTAESIAELLHRPLYSVTVGELGTTVDMLEKKLAMILEMTESWNAVLLIDECDLFLEKRTDSMSLERTAMTSIFLRLLERHKGVMFLTTNRINSLDTAFESRISIVTKYDKLDVDARLQIWKNLLIAAKVEGLTTEDIVSLSQHDINGRQIKNSIRMSQALAFDSSEELNVSHFNTVMENVSF